MAFASARQGVLVKPSTRSVVPVPCVARAAAQRGLTARTTLSVVAQAAAVEAPAPVSNQIVLGNTDKYAIIEVGGTQQLVEEGKWYTCNRLQAEPGATISFGRVLAVKQDGLFHVGRPYLDTATVEAEVLEELKGPKVVIYKMKPKKHTRKRTGHRQPLTKFLITKIDRT